MFLVSCFHNNPPGLKGDEILRAILFSALYVVGWHTIFRSESAANHHKPNTKIPGGSYARSGGWGLTGGNYAHLTVCLFSSTAFASKTCEHEHQHVVRLIGWRWSVYRMMLVVVSGGTSSSRASGLLCVLIVCMIFTNTTKWNKPSSNEHS